jgi:hypothetical protein
MSDPVVIPGEPDTTIVEPDPTIVEANPTIIVTPPAEPEPEPEPVAEPVVTHQCLTLGEVEEMMRRVLDDMAIEEVEPEPEPEPPKAPEHDTPPEPSHPFFRRRGGRK